MVLGCDRRSFSKGSIFFRNSLQPFPSFKGARTGESLTEIRRACLNEKRCHMTENIAGIGRDGAGWLSPRPNP